jgi:hypothetical protein
MKVINIFSRNDQTVLLVKQVILFMKVKEAVVDMKGGIQLWLGVQWFLTEAN